MAFNGNAGANIRLVGEATRHQTYSHSELAGIFRENFLKEHTTPIHEAIIEHVAGNTFLAHLRHAMLYCFETVQFGVQGDEITDVQRNYEASESVASSPPSYALPDDLQDYGGGYNVFVGTPVATIPTAVAMVNDVYNYAKAMGYTPYRVIGAGANIATYQKFLQDDLAAFISVGHGNTNGILLADGTLSYTWFNTLGSKALSPQVITWNSCQVFNDPLKSSILTHGARTFVGGVTNLAIGPSEKVTSGFWHTSFSTDAAMATTLRNLNAKYPDAGTFGIGGDTGAF